MNTIVYIGAFRMPDKNAAAHRVLNNARILRSLGYNVVFVGLNPDADENFSDTLYTYDGFEIYELKCRSSMEKIRMFSSMKWVKELLVKYNVSAIFAYDYYALGLCRLKKICKSKKMPLVADTDEWFSATGSSFAEKIIRKLDSEIRMRVIQPRIDGVIVISSFLYNYYENKTVTVKIPPLVDCTDRKYINDKLHDNNVPTLVYAGSPSTVKEALGDVVKCLGNLNDVDFRLRIFGIEESYFKKVYNVEYNKEKIKFMGRVTHETALDAVKTSDYSIIIRPNNRVTTAGFPTKFVEALSCNTAVIANDFGDIAEYIKNGKNGYIVDINDLENEFRTILTLGKVPPIEKQLFDYRRYTSHMKVFLETIGL